MSSIITNTITILSHTISWDYYTLSTCCGCYADQHYHHNSLHFALLKSTTSCSSLLYSLNRKPHNNKEAIEQQQHLFTFVVVSDNTTHHRSFVVFHNCPGILGVMGDSTVLPNQYSLIALLQSHKTPYLRQLIYTLPVDW